MLTIQSRLSLRSLTLACASFLAATAGIQAQQPDYDLVLTGGRVIDPETGLDAIRNVGIVGGFIGAVTEEPLTGREVIDVSGLVVSPGFIDLHAHGQDLFSSGLQAQDGVTTALELEGGTGDVENWYATREGKALIHYGASASHGRIRGGVLGGQQAAVRRSATLEQLEMMADRLRDQLAAGALGIGYGIQYTPGARREEIFHLFRMSAEEGVTNFVHVRYAGVVEPGSSIEAVHEMIGNAAGTGASVHIVHVGSSGLHQVPTILEMIEGAQSNGLDVTTEVYPYTAASTGIQAAIFDPGWRERFNADFSDIEWVATGERLDEESFYERRQSGGTIIAHIIPEEAVKTALAHPLVMVASDGTPFVNGRAHPRGAGTFARPR
ncbi:MAG: amidohydrolase family protein, partial [Gemmatimonadota bacterium]|nr:amidohydrolase family protein [Gemmatimonadota bacterium]